MKKCTQLKLSIKTNLSQSRISTIENNIKDAKIKELLDIAAALNVHVIDLIDFKEIDKDTLLKLKDKIKKELND